MALAAVAYKDVEKEDTVSFLLDLFHDKVPTVVQEEVIYDRISRHSTKKSAANF